MGRTSYVLSPRFSKVLGVLEQAKKVALDFFVLNVAVRMNCRHIHAAMKRATSMAPRPSVRKDAKNPVEVDSGESYTYERIQRAQHFECAHSFETSYRFLSEYMDDRFSKRSTAAWWVPSKITFAPNTERCTMSPVNT